MEVLGVLGGRVGDRVKGSRFGGRSASSKRNKQPKPPPHSKERKKRACAWRLASPALRYDVMASGAAPAASCACASSDHTAGSSALPAYSYARDRSFSVYSSACFWGCCWGVVGGLLGG